MSRALAVNFSQANIWSPSAQFAIEWKWPPHDMAFLGSILDRRVEPAEDSHMDSSEVTLLTIKFDGSILAREIVRPDFVKGKLFVVHPGDVVFSKIDVRNGAIGIAPNDLSNMRVTSEFPVYKVKENRGARDYVKLLFRTSAFMKILNSMISGASGRKRIQPSQLVQVKVPIPHRHTQDRIVAHWHEAIRQHEILQARLFSLIQDIGSRLKNITKNFDEIGNSKVFIADYSFARRWDTKGGRAAAFIAANPDFIRLGDYAEECTKTVRPWDEPEKEWPVYGVNNKTGVFLSNMQLGAEFNTPYKKIEKDFFFHNPTRANVGSIGIVPEVPEDAVTSPEYQVWKIKDGFLPEFMALMVQTDYFLSLVAFNRVGGVKQRMYYANLAEIRLPEIEMSVQEDFAKRRAEILIEIAEAEVELAKRKIEIEEMILGTRAV